MVNVEVFLFALLEFYVVELAVFDFGNFTHAFRNGDSIRTILNRLDRKIKRALLSLLIDNNSLILLDIIVGAGRERILRHNRSRTFPIIIRNFKQYRIFTLLALIFVEFY